jgi:hypothetical protein
MSRFSKSYQYTKDTRQDRIIQTMIKPRRSRRRKTRDKIISPSRLCPSNLTPCIPSPFEMARGTFPRGACSPFRQLGWGKGVGGIGLVVMTRPGSEWTKSSLCPPCLCAERICSRIGRMSQPKIPGESGTPHSAHGVAILQKSRGLSRAEVGQGRVESFKQRSNRRERGGEKQKIRIISLCLLCLCGENIRSRIARMSHPWYYSRTWRLAAPHPPTPSPTQAEGRGSRRRSPSRLVGEGFRMGVNLRL